MASIKKLGKKFYVYYYHPFLRKPNGNFEQLYEKFNDELSAEKRKIEIEYQLKNGRYTSPTNLKVEDYFRLKYLPIYAIPKWIHKTYDTNMHYWNTDILPYFGRMYMTRVSPTDIESFMVLMRNKRVRNMKKTSEIERPYLSETTLRYIYTLIHCFFNKAVQWDDIEKSPVKCDKPIARNIMTHFWQSEHIGQALEKAEDELLHLAIHMAFRCSMRIGEVCAMDWDSINFEDNELTISKTLQRVTLDALTNISPKEVFYIFEPNKESNKTRLILKTPKSESGIRVNTISEQLCNELQQRKSTVAREKEQQHSQYKDHNLVFCKSDGNPIDPSKLSGRFNKWQLGLNNVRTDKVKFHSIRISSTSLKLFVSGGDIKSVQKALGDKTTDMVLKTYARSLDK